MAEKKGTKKAAPKAKKTDVKIDMETGEIDLGKTTLEGQGEYKFPEKETQPSVTVIDEATMDPIELTTDEEQKTVEEAINAVNTNINIPDNTEEIVQKIDEATEPVKEVTEEVKKIEENQKEVL